MKKFTLSIICLAVFVAATACGTAEKTKPVASNYDTASYDAGYQDGIKAVLDDPDNYELVKKEFAEEYVKEHYEGDYETIADFLDEYAEEYGYYKAN